ncbi:DUF4267 domain-containing protein [Nocardia mexicana]|uniref:Uncharacterized protein DUF4267 n=1 Tax=Nocardia mexicana TaxID=279262 RepID=A0A370GZD4_9NOCA|nr:DUF4267 domain-containing protein [Nocardia mexicana]RDI49001.1 uncharacterized protein DUF4267 [Nocardia mexicana]
MLTTIAYGLAIVLNLLILVVGIRFLVAPWAAAARYGVRAEQDRAYLTIKGIRDGTFGLVGLALLAFAGAPAAALYMLVVAVAPFGDTVVVLRNGGTKAVAFGIHFATAVAYVLSAVLLFAL